MNNLMCLILSILVIVQLLRKGDAEDVTNVIDISNDNESTEVDFGYEGTEGPSFWGKKYSHCVGKHQSPIDIEEHDVKVVDMPPIKYTNFDKAAEMDLTNNGHTVLIKINAEISIEGGPLISKYSFAQMHFHWGKNNLEGSETRINNHSYPMELHMVFYNADYGGISEAIDHPDGLCVLSFLYSTHSEENPNYKDIIKALAVILEPTSKVHLSKALSLDNFLTDRGHYFTYGGSLTTPPCAEVVTWIEYQSTIPLGSEQVEAFRHLHSGHGMLSKNFRPPQPLHGRTIRSNRDITRSSATNKSYNLFLLIINITALYFLRKL